MTLAASMLHVATSLTDSLLFRWFALLAVVCALITLGLAAIRRILRWADAEVERAVREALAIEADDAELDTWVAEAIAIANTAAFETAVLADIAALPTTRETE